MWLLLRFLLVIVVCSGTKYANSVCGMFIVYVCTTICVQNVHTLDIILLICMYEAHPSS